VTRRLAAVEAAREAFGFQAQIGLREGLGELIEWHAGVLAAEAVKVA
jgi:nucleoside-diphosphate-sugar epimerase